jgi:hypothetical protein
VFKLSRQDWQEKSEPIKLISWKLKILKFFVKFYLIAKTTNLNICQVLEALFHSLIQAISLANFHEFQTKTTRIVNIHFEENEKNVCKQTGGRMSK